MKPIIGITCREKTAITNYTETIKEFNGEPITYISLEKPITEHLASINEYIKEIDGLLLPGGGDIDPTHFFQKRHPTTYNVSRSRDALELRLCRKAIEENVPVFGICRGIQVMNVAMFGSLYQDTDKVYPKKALTHPNVNGLDSEHQIEIREDSLLGKIIGQTTELVNSSHHQAVDVLGEGLVVTATSSDGIIEAIEDKSKKFVLGVQYHPERMTTRNEFLEHRQKLFEAFINASIERKESK